ncbi:uncharacterized protein LOC116273361 [Papio anubis]|uniref:uncharacterized protein LOC116273361 n=1 Tax=Papio anubis TaxID=9555 RepID=UPI0012AD9532|nr:uncharacterized protein LOC116273361 [Papio anubis]
MNHAARGGWVRSDTSNPAGRGVLGVPDSFSLRIAGPHRQATAPAPDWKRHSGDHRSQPELGPRPRSRLRAAASGVLQAPPRGWPRRMQVPSASPHSPAAAAPPAQLLLSGRSQPHQELPKRKDLCGFRTPARQWAGPADARPFTRVSLTPPEAGSGSVTRHSSVALTTAGVVGVEKPQVLREGGGRHGSQEHEELVSVSDLFPADQGTRTQRHPHLSRSTNTRSAPAGYLGVNVSS